MKTMYRISIFCFIPAALLMAGCSPTADIIEIRERMFIGQVNEIYMNADVYIGKTIKLEGVFLREHWEWQDYNFVVRYGPGCCGDDGLVGFQVAFAENQSYPQADSWVQAVGELKFNHIGDSSNLYLELSSITVMDTRGEEFVLQ